MEDDRGIQELRDFVIVEDSSLSRGKPKARTERSPLETVQRRTLFFFTNGW